jgi:hypothetical protein
MDATVVSDAATMNDAAMGSAMDSAVPAPMDAAVDPTTDSMVSLDAGLDATASTDSGPADAAIDAAVVTWPLPCADIYAQDALPSFDLIISPAEWAGMQSDCNNGTQFYRPIQLSYGAETVDAMARLKGNWSWNCGKMQFVISFNEVDPKGRFHGLRKLVFDASWYDRTVMHERMAFPLFEKLGLPYSCVNNAKVSINGTYYGVYANVERIDKEYLQRHFEGTDADGNLYQGGVELKTNETMPDTSRLTALQAATTVADLDALIDLDEAVVEWAAEAMVPAMDNYWAGVEINYYLYDHPTRGFMYLPYDLDIAFGDAKYTDGSLIWSGSATADPITYEHPQWKKEALFQTVIADAFWCGRFVEELQKARAAYVPAEMQANLDTWEQQISQAVIDDPNPNFDASEHQASVTELRAFIDTRAAFVDQWLAAGNHCPVQ